MNSRTRIKSFKLFITVICTIALTSQTQANDSPLIEGTVTSISDGDTVGVTPTGAAANRRKIKVRMIGMDTPELHLPTDHGMEAQGDWGQLATDFINTIIHIGSEVKLETHGQDHYGRTLGRVYADDIDINYQMVLSGWAIPYIICSGTECQPGYLEKEKVDDYFKACADARSEGRGIWNPDHLLTEMPFEFRLRMQNRQPDKFVADYYSQEYVSPQDYSRIDVCTRVFFEKAQDAERMGFSTQND